MKDAKQKVEEFWHLAQSRCAFDLKNGVHLEGYILSVEETHIVFGGGGPLASGEDELIATDDLDLSTLAYWSESVQCWMDVTWDEERQQWESAPVEQTPPEDVSKRKKRFLF